jgi:2-polyprenyl-3-methyl-5-hydroxy-6-metoxy-1,4-benzoquinol methylase
MNSISYIINRNYINNIDYLLLKFLNTTNLSFNENKLIKKKLLDIFIKNKDKNDIEILKICNHIFTFIELHKKSRDRTYILNKIFPVINEYINLNENDNILDFGGGDGSFIYNLGKCKNISNNNIYCIETTEWVEKYNKINNNINYIYWDNENINIDTSMKFNLITCMVVLHHIPISKRKIVIQQLHKLLNDDGILMIKEHSCENIKDLSLIKIEHLLYHSISEEKDLNNYEKKSIENYMSFNEINELLIDNNFKIISLYEKTFNNKISLNQINDNKNPTNLYWIIAKKNIL